MRLTGEEYKERYGHLHDYDKPTVRFGNKTFFVRRSWNLKWMRVAWFLCDTENRYNVMFLKNDAILIIDEGDVT
jgi:hypothetical protein